MFEYLDIPEQFSGRLWRYVFTGRTRYLHRHAELEFNLVTSGACVYLIGDRKYELRRNTLLWLFPDQDHVMLEETEDHEMWIGVFKSPLLRSVCSSAETALLLETDPPSHYIRRLGHATGEELSRTCGYVEGQASFVDAYNAGLGFAAVAAWKAYCEAESNTPGDDIHRAVEKAIRLIRSDPETQNVDQLAIDCGLSASRLSLLFKKQTGMTIVHFRNRQRMERFLRIYGTFEGESLMEAALEAGFGSYAQFHRVFKENMGVGSR